MIFARRTLTCLTLLALLSAFSGRAEAQSVMIKAKHVAGEKSYLEQTMEVQQKLEGGPIPGGSMEIGVQRTYGLTRKVESASDGGAKITLTYDRACQKVDSPMFEAAYDSDSPNDEDDSPIMATPLKAMVGGTLNLNVDKDGQIKEFSGMKAILEKVEEAAGGGNMFLVQMRNELSDERAKVTYGELMYLMYPNKEVKVGDSWKKTIHDKLPQIGNVVSQYEYKLDRVSEEAGRKVAVVTYKSTMDKDNSAKDDGDSHMGKSEVKGSTTGTMTYDIERGLVTKSVSSGTTNVVMNQEKPKAKKGDDDEDAEEDAPKPMKIDIKIKQTYTLMSDADRTKQKEEAAKHQKAASKKDDAKKAKKAEKKPAKKSNDDDEDE